MSTENKLWYSKWDQARGEMMEGTVGPNKRDEYSEKLQRWKEEVIFNPKIYLADFGKFWARNLKEKDPNKIFLKWGRESKAVWNFSKKLSVFVWPLVPKGWTNQPILRKQLMVDTEMSQLKNKQNMCGKSGLANNSSLSSIVLEHEQYKNPTKITFVFCQVSANADIFRLSGDLKLSLPLYKVNSLTLLWCSLTHSIVMLTHSPNYSYKYFSSRLCPLSPLSGNS